MNQKKKNLPPVLARWLVSKLTDYEHRFSLEGDLRETFEYMTETDGVKNAKLWYWSQALKSVFLYFHFMIMGDAAMLKNYLIVALRNIKKNKVYSLINISGLAVGIACTILIFLYVQNELTYDRYHENSDRIFRISGTYVTSGEPIRFAPASPALGPRLKEEFPEIEEYVRIIQVPQTLFDQKERNVTFYESNIVLADSSIFKVFSYEFLLGDPAKCLADPKSIVLTEALAVKYFGNENPMGKLLQVRNQDDLKVTGVIKTPPQNSHITIEGIAPYALWDTNNQSVNWSMFEIFGLTYVLLPQNYDFDRFHEKWQPFYDKYCAEDAVSYGQVFEPNFIKLTNIRYGNLRFRFDVEAGSKSYLHAFIAIGIFILVLACINYINMTTAHAATRAKEIGIKKVLGSDKRTLILQILGESFLISFLGLLAAFVLLKIFLMSVPIEQLLNFNVELNFLNNPILLIVTLGLFLFIGLSSGSYPAFYITSVMPATVLSGVLKSGMKGLFIRRVLVASQFAIFIGVVVLMLFMNDQVDFMRNKNLGFKKENVVSIPLRDQTVVANATALKEELLKHPEIISAAFGFNRPGRPSTGLYRLEGKEGMEEHNFHVFFVRYNYLETLGLELVNGRDFERTHATDSSSAVIINETLMKFMGLEDPIGKRITQGSNLQGEVIGVIKDFNFQSLHNKIEPLLIRMQRRPGGSLFLKIHGQNIVHTISLIQEKWVNINQNMPFEYDFLDEEFGRLYDADQRLNKLVKLFSTICVLISCLGVLGLSSFNSIRRTKEIAIRKVHGASAVRIVVILFKEILFLFVTASVIILPVSLILIDSWLKNFAYRTDINLWLFIGTTLAGVLIAFFTAGYHSIKVANTNPIKSIRYE